MGFECWKRREVMCGQACVGILVYESGDIGFWEMEWVRWLCGRNAHSGIEDVDGDAVFEDPRADSIISMRCSGQVFLFFAPVWTMKLNIAT